MKKKDFFIYSALIALIEIVGHIVLSYAGYHSNSDGMPLGISYSAELLKLLGDVWNGLVAALGLFAHVMEAGLAGFVFLAIPLLLIIWPIIWIAGGIGYLTKEHKTQVVSRGIGRDFQLKN
jgi:hypothetical protein